MPLVFLVSALTSINLRFSLLRERKTTDWLLGWALRFIILSILGLISWYFFMPSFTGPIFGLLSVAWAPLLINIIITAIGIATDKESYSKNDERDYTIMIIITVVYVLAELIFLSAPYFDTPHLRGMIGEVEYVRDYPPSADTDHISVVPLEGAQYDANKLMGNPIPELGLSTAGSVYKIGTMTKQSIPVGDSERDVWVAPIEYRDVFKAWSNDFTPGYVIVDAEDPTAEPRLVRNLNLRYVETGIFGNNLRRHIYSDGYEDYRIKEITFILDDDLNPYYWALLTRPTAGFTADEVEIMLLVDPQSGKMTPYRDIDELPSWIERTIPEDVLESRLTWWGRYVLGLWNSIFAERNVILPVSINNQAPDVYLVRDPNGVVSFVVGYTSRGNDDAALAGVMYVNARTQKATFYTWVPEDETPPSLGNEDDASDAVEKALAINAGAYSPAQPVMYRVYGRQVFIVPIITENNTDGGTDETIVGNRQEGVALYDAQAQQTFLGDEFKGGTKEEVLDKYLTWIRNQGSDVDPDQGGGQLVVIEGVVKAFDEVVRGGNTVYKIILDDPNTIYLGPDTVSPWLWATNVGDEVRIEFDLIHNVETGEPAIEQPISRFRNITMFGEQEAAGTPTPVFTPTPTPTPLPTPTPGLDDN